MQEEFGWVAAQHHLQEQTSEAMQVGSHDGSIVAS